MYDCSLQVLDSGEHPDGYVLEGSTPVAKADEAVEEKPAAQPVARAPAGVSAGGDGVINIASDDENSAQQESRGTKRKADEDGAGPSTKVAKSDIIEID